tara:strand:+ start:107 stop:382 length:276 start_codon:yes stop_codon:yes gene_type:complete
MKKEIKIIKKEHFDLLNEVKYLINENNKVFDLNVVHLFDDNDGLILNKDGSVKETFELHIYNKVEYRKMILLLRRIPNVTIDYYSEDSYYN